jgi:hypothetical protein
VFFCGADNMFVVELYINKGGDTTNLGAGNMKQFEFFMKKLESNVLDSTKSADIYF